MLSSANEVDPLIFCCVCFVCDTNIYFSNIWYQSGLQFRICITCFVSVGITDSNFMLLEDYTFNFLHGCWNYYFIKTDIDVMMLFKFDIKYVKLNFKAIASMVFIFNFKLNLLYSYNGSLFMKNRWKLLGKNSRKFSFTSLDRSRIPFNRSNVPFQLIKQESKIDRVKQIVYAETRIENWSSQADCLCWIY